MSLQIKLIKFYKYKALSDYSINLRGMNIFVGPNNCGKSTIISSFRILDVALRIANSRTPTKVPHAEGCSMLGHPIPESHLPVSLENVHTNYADEDSMIEFYFDDEKKLVLFFPSSGGCFLNWDKSHQGIRTKAEFKELFPFKVQVVPVLGPLEHEEAVLTEETVKNGLGTHRASRHFRNFWARNTDQFENFRKMIVSTWPGMNLKKPEITGKNIFMFCSENRIDREIFWAGFGFQIDTFRIRGFYILG